MWKQLCALSLIAACKIPDLSWDKPSGALGDGPTGPEVDAPTGGSQGQAPPDGDTAGSAVPPPPPEAQSCASLPTTCGPNGNESCCTTLPVQGDTFFRSYDKVGDGASGNQTNRATVSSFRLDKYEITVGRFRAFVDAGMGTRTTAPAANAGAHANIGNSGWRTSFNADLPVDKTQLLVDLNCSTDGGGDEGAGTWTNAPGPHELRPMNCISWSLAMAFCIWDGGYLPTEAEWNYAATGGDEQRPYAWSVPATTLVIDDSRASYSHPTDDHCFGDGVDNCVREDVRFVGTLPAGNGRWGHADLTGNLDEWTLDVFSTSYDNPCNDCAHLGAGTQRAVRGGSAAGGPAKQRVGFRLGNETTALGASWILGARCARPM